MPWFKPHLRNTSLFAALVRKAYICTSHLFVVLEWLRFNEF